MTERTSWRELRESRAQDPEWQAAYERARRAHELGARIRQLREERGMSQAELGERMGTKQSAIARLELGGADPRLGTLERLSAALGLDLVIDFQPKQVPAGAVR